MYNRKRVIPQINNKNNNTNDVKIDNIHNRFDVVVRNVETGEETKCFAENVVTNIAWQEIIFKREANVLRVGSSSTPEDPTQTNLITPFNNGITASSTVYAWHGSNGNKRTTTFFMGLSVNNGQTISEVGLTNSTSYPYVLNRAILKDINGNPITIVKTDLIEVTFYVTIYVTISLQPWQSVISTSSLFSLINKGNQDMTLYSLTGSNSSWAATAPYTATAGRLSKKTPRVQPTELNKGVSLMTSFGIQHDLLRKTNFLYDLIDQPLATGDGSKRDFYCGYYMEEITLYRNGVVIPTTEYVFNKYADDQSEKNFTEFKCNIHLIDEKGKRLNNTNRSWIQPGILVLQPEIPYSRMHFYIGNATAASFIKVEGSNDNGLTWTTLLYGSRWEEKTLDLTTIKTQYKWLRNSSDVYASSLVYTANIFATGGPQILFNTPPAAGDVLTFSGKTRCIPKDSDHVMEVETYLTYTDPNL